MKHRASESSRAVDHRVVQSLDPSLSARANYLLTQELRRVIGTAEADVPSGEPHYERRRHGKRKELLVTLVDNRLFLAMIAAAAIILAVVVALATETMWVVSVPVALDVIGIGFIVAVVFQMSGEAEHLSPDAVALLEDEGVTDPDELFKQLINEFDGR